MFIDSNLDLMTILTNFFDMKYELFLVDKFKLKKMTLFRKGWAKLNFQRKILKLYYSPRLIGPLKKNCI
jgi:hypothetical protein